MDQQIEFSSRRATARLTGWLYFFFALMGFLGMMVIGPRLIVAGNAAATAQNMVSQEWLFRANMSMGIVTSILFIVIVLLLYKLLRQVNSFQAGLMVALVLVSIPVIMMQNVLELTALSIFKGKLLADFETARAQSLAMVLIKLSGNAAQLLTLIWGLWLFPLAWLVYRSGFFPKLLGILLLVNGIAYVVQCFTFILFPEQLKAVAAIIFPAYFTGEIPFTFWLMIRGIRKNGPAADFSAVSPK